MFQIFFRHHYIVIFLIGFLVSCTNLERVGDKDDALAYSIKEAPAVEYQGGFQSLQGVNPAVSALLSQAYQHELNMEYDLAISKLERALRISPNAPQVHLQLASVRLKQNQAYEALQIALKGQSLLSDKSQDLVKPFWRLIGDCYTNMGQSAKASEAYKHL